jgi:3-oxoacyl-[acyl-carrier-protein] synthase II
MNDRVESDGILMAFDNNPSQVMVSSTKAATGHLLGAAGAIEAVIAALALRDQMVPPTLHLERPISSLDYVPNTARPAEFKYSCSLSYGFGGQMGGVLFERMV